MRGYTFTLVDRADVPEIMGIYRSLIGSSGGIWRADYPTVEIAYADVENGSLYAMRRDGRIIAVISVSSPEELDGVSWTPKHPCQLNRLGVVAEQQNHGVGATVLREAMAVAKERGFDGLTLLVGQHSPAAIALYDKVGFRRCGEFTGWGNDFYCYEMSL